jgi:hypothetical protein
MCKQNVEILMFKQMVELLLSFQDEININLNITVLHNIVII